MILLRKDENEFLRQKLPKDTYMLYVSSRTHKSRAKRYYSSEHKVVLQLLKEYNESLKILNNLRVLQSI